jgi:hypothetical protein
MNMLSKSVVSGLVLAAVFAAEAQTTSYSGGAARSAPGLVTIQGSAGREAISAVKYQLPPACAGKTVMLAAEFRTRDISGGTKSYHGVHFDYEIVIDGKTSWSGDWEEAPSADWSTVTRTWDLPANMTRATLRIGLQGVDGHMEVRNIRVSSC